MTDVRLVTSFIVAVLTMGTLLTAWSLVMAVRDWRLLERRQINGARGVIAVAQVRLYAFRVVKQLALLWALSYRVFWNRPADPVVYGVVLLVLVGVLVCEAFADLIDRRMVRWFLRNGVDE